MGASSEIGVNEIFMCTVPVLYCTVGWQLDEIHRVIANLLLQPRRWLETRKLFSHRFLFRVRKSLSLLASLPMNIPTARNIFHTGGFAPR